MDQTAHASNSPGSQLACRQGAQNATMTEQWLELNAVVANVASVRAISTVSFVENTVS